MQSFSKILFLWKFQRILESINFYLDWSQTKLLEIANHVPFIHSTEYILHQSSLDLKYFRSVNNLFHATGLFYPLKTLENLFMFHGVQKETSSMKWVNGKTDTLSVFSFWGTVKRFLVRSMVHALNWVNKDSKKQTQIFQSF